MQFSELQKKLMKELSKHTSDGLSIAKYLQDFFFTKENGLILIRTSIKDIETSMLFVRNNTNDEIRREKIAQFIEILSLLDYLDCERKVFTIYDDRDSNMRILFNEVKANLEIKDGKCIIDNEDSYILVSDSNKIFGANGSIDYTLTELPKSTLPLINKYVFGFSFPSSLLKEFIDNNFSTEEQIRHKEAMRSAKIQVRIAWLAFATALIIPFVVGTCVPSTIKEHQFIKLNESINNIDAALQKYRFPKNVELTKETDSVYSIKLQH